MTVLHALPVAFLVACGLLTAGVVASWLLEAAGSMVSSSDPDFTRPLDDLERARQRRKAVQRG